MPFHRNVTRSPILIEWAGFLGISVFLGLLSAICLVRVYDAAISLPRVERSETIFSTSWVQQLHRTDGGLPMTRNRIIQLFYEPPHRVSPPLTNSATTPPVLHPFKEVEWQTLVIRAKDTLPKLLKQANIPHEDYRALLLLPAVRELAYRLKPNQALKVIVSPTEHRLERLKYDIDLTHTLEVVKVSGHWTTTMLERRLTTALRTSHGVIRSSLSEVLKDHQLPGTLLQDLSSMFESKIDLSRQLQRGDRLSLVYEQYLLDHKPVKTGRVVAAKLETRRKTVEVVRYQDLRGKSAYYTPDGKNVTAAFLPFPVTHHRVSSHFNMRRLHPLLHIVRPHLGVDFAAPQGSPVKATGEGKVIFCGRKGGYGKVVILKHGTRYTTLYAHLDRFASGVSANHEVTQGEIIGYVGQTGFATGPHLHYEFHINDIPRDPLAVQRMAMGQPIPAHERARFLAETGKWLEALRT